MFQLVVHPIFDLLEAGLVAAAQFKMLCKAIF